MGTTSGGPERRRMIGFRAKFDGRCVVCDQRHIRKGDQVDKRHGGVAAVVCIAKSDRILSRERYVVQVMREKYRIGLGCFGIGEGLTPTYSRAQFYAEARSRGLYTVAEENEASLFYGWSWMRDLSD